MNLLYCCVCLFLLSLVVYAFINLTCTYYSICYSSSFLLLILLQCLFCFVLLLTPCHDPETSVKMVLFMHAFKPPSKRTSHKFLTTRFTHIMCICIDNPRHATACYFPEHHLEASYTLKQTSRHFQRLLFYSSGI